ncbi:MAG: FeoB-associated Cys-rich membrane protein [Lachnospiraceae bacterium]|nr:FeoB-associated Cys-rich membrane protein [Lachnospiraceae bacterium]MBR5967151.1 FeoB-associated Cys-rich membrane protein [Lachnospiraceae bacterium]
MIAWFSANLGTILVTILLILIVTGIIRSMIKDKKQGKSTCGGNCAHCKMCTACRQAAKKTV